MRILYLHQYFITPSESGGTRSYWFAKELLVVGYNVTMITSRTTQKKLFEKERIDGIDVIYIRNRYSNNMSIYARLISFAKFMLLSSWVAFRQKDINLVYATSTPLSIGVPALICKWVKGFDYIFEVRDLWPEVPIQMGAIKNKLIIKLFYWFEALIYKNAQHIVALSPGMAKGVIKYGIRPEKVSMIPNMAKIDEFYPRNQDFEIAKIFEIDLNKFNIIHFGAMGIANGLDYIIYAAEILKDQGINDVEFILLGDGGVKEKLIQMAKKLELKNIKFIDSKPMKIVSEIVNLSNCSIVTFSNIPILRTNSPNKLFDSLSAGKPIIVNSSGWTKNMIEYNNCGAYIDPEMPENLVSLITKWKENPELLNKLGSNARKLAVNAYDKSILSQKFVNLISSYV